MSVPARSASAKLRDALARPSALTEDRLTRLEAQVSYLAHRLDVNDVIRAQTSRGGGGDQGR
ncbi:MAG: hypothetical protein ACR2LV_05095 [Solirubrobacteraceae bacterium]